MYTWNFPSSDDGYIAVQFDGEDIFDVTLYRSDLVNDAVMDKDRLAFEAMIANANIGLRAV